MRAGVAEWPECGEEACECTLGTSKIELTTFRGALVQSKKRQSHNSDTSTELFCLESALLGSKLAAIVTQSDGLFLRVKAEIY